MIAEREEVAIGGRAGEIVVSGEIEGRGETEGNEGRGNMTGKEEEGECTEKSFVTVFVVVIFTFENMYYYVEKVPDC